MFRLTTKKINDLNIGESVVLCVDDIEYKLLKNVEIINQPKERTK